MKICTACGGLRHRLDKPCAACGYAVSFHDGIPLLAPEGAGEAEGFDSTYFSSLIKLEGGSFWFRGRNRIIEWMVRRYCPQAAKLLEIGCGTAYVVGHLAKVFPRTQFWGSEVFLAGLELAKARSPDIRYLQMDARRIPFVEEFDAIGAFDVLEHIEDDGRVLAEVRKALRPGGHLLITVPQHRWLWGPSDEYAKHVRRYEYADLARLMETHGFEMVRTSSFISMLLPMMWLSRTLQKRRPNVPFDPGAEFALPRWLDRVLEKILLAEAFLIRAGFSFPVGGSRFVVARKS